MTLREEVIEAIVGERRSRPISITRWAFEGRPPTEEEWVGSLRGDAKAALDAICAVPKLAEHYLVLYHDGWYIQHSFSCRLDDTDGVLGRCEVHEAVERDVYDNQLLPTGRYRVWVDNGEMRLSLEEKL